MDTILGNEKKEGKGIEFAKDLGRQNATDLARKQVLIQIINGRIA
jgi:hypothetical protein